jgi:hypothetical protein
VTVDPRVSEVLLGNGVAALDERGLMPLAEARAVLHGVEAFVKGEGEIINGRNVLASDVLWSALLSLEDAAELVTVASRLDWQFQPRGMENVDLHRRYGDGIVPWLAGRVDDSGVLHDRPWCVVPCLLACDGDDAFALAWRVKRVAGRQITLASAWLDRHPVTGAAALARLIAANPDDRRARAHQHALARRTQAPLPSGPPSADDVLALLDACAARLLSQAIMWPALDGKGPARPHGFRAVAARAGDDWGLAIERIEGERKGGVQGARIAVHAFGSRVRGGASVSARPLAIDVSDAPKDAFGDWLSARVADDLEAVTGPAALSLPMLALPADATIVAVIPSLAHVSPTAADPQPDDALAPNVVPSQAAVYRALAAAIAS